MANKLKLRIPKRIAGVEIPKTVRKGPVAKFLNSSAGQLLLAEALVVVGGALAAERSGSGSRLAELVRNRASGAAKDGEEVDNGREASRLSFALNEAMSAFRRPKKNATGSTTETPSMQH